MSLGTASRTGRWSDLAANRDLRLLLSAGLISQTGDWILGTGIAFEVYALTGSTIASAVALLATQAPQVVFGSVAGVLVDRADRRRVMVLVNVLLSLVLLPLFWVQDASQVWLIFVVVGLSSCLTPFFAAAEMALLPSLVDEDQLVTANALNAQVRNVSRLLGAALGGVVVATGGLAWLAVADIVTFAAAAILIILIRHRSVDQAAEPLHPLRDWVEGFGTILRSRALVVVVLFYAVSGVGEAAMGTLFAAFTHDVVGGTAQDFGTFMAAQAVGGIVGGLLVTALAHRFSPRALFGWGAVLFGLGDLALFTYPLAIPAVWPGVVIIAAVGVPGAALFAGLLTIFQTNTSNRVRGRVFGALTTVQNLTMLLTTYAAGASANVLGIIPVISVQAVVYVVVGALALVVLRGATAVPERGADPVDEADDDHERDWAATLDNPALSTRLPNMPLASNVRLRTVTDPLAMRALAHPLRVELYGLVGRDGSLTAAAAAKQLGISHALASHHLRQLAKYGFIEPAEAADERARPWRVSATNVEFRPEEPEGRASADVVDRYYAELATQRLAEWQERRATEDPALDRSAGVSNSLLYLTPAELDEVRQAWAAIVDPLAEARPLGHLDQRPEGTVPVSLTLIAAPLEPTERGG